MSPTIEPEPVLLFLEVPVVDATQSIGAAIVALTRMHRSALIETSTEARTKNKMYRLLHAVDLYRARSEKKSSLADIPKTETVRFGAADTENLALLYLESNLPVADALSNELSRRNLPLALVRLLPEGSTGILAMLSQTVFDDIKSGPADCYCTGPRKHPFPPPTVQSGDTCPFDGYSIYCKI
jgi:hypothetical protein